MRAAAGSRTDALDGASSVAIDQSVGEPGGSGSARAVIAATLAASVARLETELSRARSGDDPEGVHQARVATRRLRSDVRTFAPLLDETWRTTTRGELRRLADALGAVRDVDVLRTTIDAAADVVGIDPTAAATIHSTLDRERHLAHLVLVSVIDDERTASLLNHVRRAALDPPTTPAALGRAERRLRPLVRRRWRRLARAVGSLDDASVSELHRIRLLVKRARYAADAVEPVYGRPARRLAAALADVQDALGDINDAEAAISWLERSAVAFGSPAAFAAGGLAHHLRGIADDRRQAWVRRYRRARNRSAWLS